LPDWFLKPHKKYGTTYRLLNMIVGMQLLTIIASRGDVLILGEAYAFGVVWSFVFKALAMVVLRFRDPSPREYKVPLNVRVGRYEFPIGLTIIFLILAVSAVMNLLTKEVATTWGLGFTAAFLTIFMASEFYHERRLKGSKHIHQEQFNRATATELTCRNLGLKKPYRKLVAIRSTNNLFMLDKTLLETDPVTTDVIVMTAKVDRSGTAVTGDELDKYEQSLMTAVVEHAERVGKHVLPLIVPTNNPTYAVACAAKDLEVQELTVGLSNIYTADDQLDQLALYWISLHDGQTVPLTIRVVSRERDAHLDLAGGFRIPRLSDRQARSVAELRASGVGASRVLFVHDNTRTSHDIFESVLTLLDTHVILDILSTCSNSNDGPSHNDQIAHQDQGWAKGVNREIKLTTIGVDCGPETVRLARQGNYDVIVLPLPTDRAIDKSEPWPSWISYVVTHAHCQVFLAAQPAVPMEVES
jgi:hypothetical protein